jgi:hypothetical protein
MMLGGGEGGDGAVLAPLANGSSQAKLSNHRKTRIGMQKV